MSSCAPSEGCSVDATIASLWSSVCADSRHLWIRPAGGPTFLLASMRPRARCRPGAVKVTGLVASSGVLGIDVRSLVQAAGYVGITAIVFAESGVLLGF